MPNVLNENKWELNHDDAYFGGSCLEFQGDSKGYLKYLNIFFVLFY